MNFRYPHCDRRVLHAPEDGCAYCNKEPGLQELRRAWNIAFSGHDPVAGQTACPADLAVMYAERSDYNSWPGNRPGG